MAITLIKSEHKNTESVDAVDIEIANGDLRALKSIKDEYRLASIEDVLAFAIGVLDKASGKPITVTHDDGSTARYMPASEIKKDAGTED